MTTYKQHRQALLNSIQAMMNDRPWPCVNEQITTLAVTLTTHLGISDEAGRKLARDLSDVVAKHVTGAEALKGAVG